MYLEQHFQSSIRAAAETITIAVIYVLLGKLGQLSAIMPGNVTAVWPPSGFALAMALLLGRKALWGIGIGAFAVNTQAFLDSASLASVVNSAAVGVAIAVGSAAQPFVGAVLIKRFIDIGNLLFFTMLIPLMCLISSMIGAIALWLGGLIGADAFG